MIKPEEIKEIGSFIKPHGINGEITALFPAEVDPDMLSCIVLDMDGIFVPFFIDEWRPKATESVLLKLEGVTDESGAKEFAGKHIFCLRKDLPESIAEDDEGFFTGDLIGFELSDADSTPVGEVIDFDDQTENVLLMVKRPDGTVIYAPLAEELIVEFDPEAKKISLDLPEGIYEL